MMMGNETMNKTEEGSGARCGVPTAGVPNAGGAAKLFETAGGHGN